ncbi:UNVERIFIED_CONTAM: hypothetical protein FKN15_055656 [Acipenser sinensis]
MTKPRIVAFQSPPHPLNQPLKTPPPLPEDPAGGATAAAIYQKLTQQLLGNPDVQQDPAVTFRTTTDEMRPDKGAGFIGRAGMLNDDREALYVQGRQFQQQGEPEAALKCFLTCLQGLTHVHSFQSLPDCLHQQGTGGWLSEEDLSEQACQAGDYEKLAQVCIMSKRPHLALEYSGKATKIRQKAFGSDHPITARSLELLASVYAEIGKTDYSGKKCVCIVKI